MLESNGLTTVEGLLTEDPRDLAKRLNGFGLTSARDLERRLAEHGFIPGLSNLVLSEISRTDKLIEMVEERIEKLCELRDRLMPLKSR